MSFEQLQVGSLIGFQDRREFWLATVYKVYLSKVDVYWMPLKTIGVAHYNEIPKSTFNNWVKEKKIQYVI